MSATDYDDDPFVSDSYLRYNEPPHCNCPLADNGPDLINCQKLANCDLT